MRHVKPSPTELTLLKALWQQSPLSAREVHQLTEQQLQWSYSSTRKTLDRMQDKGLVKVEESHGIRIFRPAVSKIKTLAGFIKDFAHGVLEVDSPLPVSMFADSKLLDKKELKDLEALLEQPQNKKDKPSD